MKITDYLADTINRLPKGYIFTYHDFIGEVTKEEAIIKALNRMAASGKIYKLAKGKFYKPEKTIFGDLQPGQSQVVKDLLEEDGKVIGYLTGLGIYPKLGLSTQLGFVIQIGRNKIRPAFQRGNFRISFIMQKNTITRENIPLLQILDSIRLIKKIPDSPIAQSAKRLKSLIQDQSFENRAQLARLAKKYPPATRAILGSILEEIGEATLTPTLATTLNPVTKYSIPGIKEALPSASNWNLE